MTKTITLLTSGTRGDVVPYIALGEGLLDAGYNVRIAAPREFIGPVERSRVAFSPFDGNPSDLLIAQGDSTPMTLGKNPIRSLQATRDFFKKARPLYRRLLHSAAEACRGSDLLIHGLPTMWGAHIAEGLSIPAVRALLQPLAPTCEFSSALLPFRLSLFGIGNWFSHWVVTQAIWLSWRTEINYARRTDFGLAPAHWLDPSLQTASRQLLTLNGFSEHVLPRPHDWNEKQIITGYWRSPSTDWTPPKELERFLSSENVIAIGFGSPGIQGYLPMLEEVLTKTNTKAVLTIPAKWHREIKTTDIFPIEYVPHDWLYPRVKAAIHHGGAGTTSSSLHAGIPTITLPLAIDQFFWGERIYKLGAGPKPIPQRKLNIENLSLVISQALTDQIMKRHAQAISRALSQENGIQAAVSAIRSVL